LSALAKKLLEKKNFELLLAQYVHKNTLGDSMIFKTRPWLIDIYLENEFIRKVIQKAVQCGLTEYAIIWTFSQMYQGYSLLYVLPTDALRNDFVNNRIDKMIDDVPFYSSGSNGADNTGIKHFWHRGTVKFVGSNVPGAFREFPAQRLVIDEHDLCNKKNIDYAGDRLAAAKELTGKNPMTLIISNPTKPNRGVNGEYRMSDMKQWRVPCAHCRDYVELKWIGGVVQPTDEYTFELIDRLWKPNSGRDVNVYCPECKNTIDRHNMRARWIALHPELSDECSGYHITKLFTGQTSVAALWKIYRAAQGNLSRLERFHNSELGEPFEGSSDSLSEKDFEKCAGTYLPPDRFTGDAFAGIDVGRVFHVDIATADPQTGKEKILKTTFVNSKEELYNLLDYFNVGYFCIDSTPELHLAREIVANREGGFLARYNTDYSIRESSIDYEEKIISVNRTESLDEMVSLFIRGRMIIPANWEVMNDGEWIIQMLVSKRFLDEERARPVYVWDEDGKPDHFFHARNYCHIAGKELAGIGSGENSGFWIGAK
jgi:hypothetical protein